MIQAQDIVDYLFGENPVLLFYQTGCFTIKNYEERAME
jgi:hypothetical protein